MTKVGFVRKLKKVSGGQIKVRDYFSHCVAHPALEPYVYFTPDSKPDAGVLWTDVAADRRVAEIDVHAYDLLFVEGRDWELLPESLPPDRVVNLIQHVRHGDANDRRFAFLSRPALRICVSEQVREAIAPHALGDVAVIECGIPPDLFSPRPDEPRDGSVLIWAGKQPGLGERLNGSLQGRGADVSALYRVTPRGRFAAALRHADVFVGLPNATEGFFLPALEAMAAGCAVVCADAAGNRGFCIDGETCVMPRAGDLDDHVRAVERLLGDRALRERVRRVGREVAQRHSLERERNQFFTLLESRYPDLRAATASSAHG